MLDGCVTDDELEREGVLAIIVMEPEGLRDHDLNLTLGGGSVRPQPSCKGTLAYWR